MLPVKTIVAVTDFSEESHKAMRAADELAHKLEANLHVVHVNDPVPVPFPAEAMAHAQPEATFNVARYREHLQEHARKRLDEVANKLCTKAETVETNVLEGSPADEITDYAKQLDADLIVSGTHGRSGVKRLVLGSVAQRLVRVAERPVLTIPSS